MSVFKKCFYWISEERDGDMKLWIKRERFPNYSKIDSYTLYAMGESGNTSTPVYLHLFLLWRSQSNVKSKQIKSINKMKLSKKLILLLLNQFWTNVQLIKRITTSNH